MNGAVIFCIIFAMAILAISSFVILRYRNSTKAVLQQVLDRIDNAIAGNENKPTYDESMVSAIEEKLNQFLSLSIEREHQSEQDQKAARSFISDVSHQVRTPLSNILLYAQMLREQDNLGPETGHMAQRIHSQAEQLDFLIRELVRSSYLESQLISISAGTQSLDQLVLTACQEVEMEALKKQITIRYEECGMHCSFDLRWTLEALTNILDNGIKYSPPESKIDIAVASYELFYRIDIRDHGMGIAEEEQGLIFQRFYRSLEAAEEKGLGLGLYLVREIVSRQGGYVKVTSQKGKGSVFSLFLPA